MYAATASSLLDISSAHVCSLRDKAPPHMAMTHYTELLEQKGVVLARADSISPHLISPAEVCNLTRPCCFITPAKD